MEEKERFSLIKHLITESPNEEILWKLVLDACGRRENQWVEFKLEGEVTRPVGIAKKIAVLL